MNMRPIAAAYLSKFTFGMVQSLHSYKFQCCGSRIRFLSFWILLEYDLFKYYDIFFVIFIPFEVDFYSKIIMYVNRILPYYIIFYKKNLHPDDFWPMFCSLEIHFALRGVKKILEINQESVKIIQYELQVSGRRGGGSTVLKLGNFYGFSTKKIVMI